MTLRLQAKLTVWGLGVMNSIPVPGRAKAPAKILGGGLIWRRQRRRLQKISNFGAL